MGDELAGMGIQSWLPRSVVRAQQAEAQREAREGREAEALRGDVAEQRHERALSLYRSQAEARGEDISPVELAQGLVGGRTVGDVMTAAEAMSDREDARQRAREAREGSAAHVFFGEANIIAPGSAVSRSAGGWPESAFEADRLIDRAQGLHRDLVGYLARSRYPAAESVARSKSAQRGDVSRSASYTDEYGYFHNAGPHTAGERVQVAPDYGSITRVASGGGNLAWP